MVLAVLERRCRVGLHGADAYAATVGGVRVTEPAVDLGVAMAMASAAYDEPLPPRSVYIGEVGLAGEIRPVGGVGRRLAEASRLGFTNALVPAGTHDIAPDTMTVHEVADLVTALHRARGGGGDQAHGLRLL
jgi:DNA repair protein RadA/Sms